MNSIQKISLSALTALALATTASARPWSDYLYGLGRVNRGPRAGIERLGYQDLSASYFPAIGNFSYEVDGTERSAAFGLAYRTQRHIQAQKRKEKGKLASNLDLAKRLSSYTWGYDQEGKRKDRGAGKLIGTVMVDQSVQPAYLNQYSVWHDQASMVLGRLERAQDRELTMALRSEGGGHIRPIYVYSAEKQGDFWVCKFWDPNVSSGRDGVESADQGRFHRLRFQADGKGEPQVSWSWVCKVDNYEDFVGDEVKDAGRSWAQMTWDQVYSVDYGVSDWDYSEDKLSVGDRFRDLKIGVTNAGGQRKFIEQGLVRFGTFDETTMNPGAPGTTD